MYDATLHRLHVFRTVVDQGGIQAAATTLGITQPSVSGHVKNLEGLIGQPLLKRNRGRRFSLTPAGELVYEYARQILLAADDTQRLLAELAGEQQCQVSLAVSDGLAHSLLVPVFTDFARQRPEVMLSVHTGSLDDIRQALIAGVAALGIGATTGDIRSLESSVIGSVRVLVVASPRHQLAERRHVTIEDLSQHPFVTTLRSSSHFHLVNRVLIEAGLGGYHVAMEYDDELAVKNVVREGFGIAALLETNVEEDLRLGALVALPLSPALRPISIRLLYLHCKRFTAAEQHLIGLLRTHLGPS
ncbi:MAG TPA: LysR family transcriptional regulator [Candidatus Dormibacteraeota bacterium]|nr:LysR family transcriptional regulator [Candidatus Dormibacteraeota bacterium]